MVLTERHCVACDGTSVALPDSVEDELLGHLDNWVIDRLFVHKIRKVFTFKSFRDAIDFVNSVAVIAERECHHPDLRINYRLVTVECDTHAISGLSENDFILAAKIDQLIN